MAFTRSELLAKVTGLGEASNSDLVRATGYVSSKKDGGERLNFNAFQEALLEAMGASLDMNCGNGKAQGSRSLRYITKVQGNGKRLVGGVAKMTLYKQFGSKEELIAAVLERLAGEITSSLATRLATANGGSHGRILAVFDWLAD